MCAVQECRGPIEVARYATEPEPQRNSICSRKLGSRMSREASTAVSTSSEFPPVWRMAGQRDSEAPKEISRKNLPASDFAQESARHESGGGGTSR